MRTDVAARASPASVEGSRGVQDNGKHTRPRPAGPGATELLRRDQPVAAVCVYHYPEHLWSLPLTLVTLLPRHQFALRCHGQDGWESVCYAIPESRCRH